MAPPTPRSVEVSIQIDVAPDRVISAFTELPLLREWWGVERCLIEKKAGGVYTLVWQISQDGVGYVSAGIIESYQPDSHLVLAQMTYIHPRRAILGPMRLSVHCQGSEQTTEVKIRQEGYQYGGDWDWYYEAVSSAWPQMAEVLKRYLEDGALPSL